MKLIFASLPLLLSIAASAADRELVRVNGTPIRESEVVERLLKRYGQQTVDEMIDDLLLRQAAVDRGVTADDAEIERRLTKLQAQFGSRELFLSQLEQAGSSLSKVKEQLADEIVRERLVIQAENLSVTDAEVRKAFDQRKAQLGRPEAVHLRHILVATEAQAEKIVAQIKAGADFAKLAREDSLAASGKSAGGDYGFVPHGMLPAEIDAVAFAMKPGEIRIVPGERGAHILQVLARRPAQPAVFDQVKDDLRAALLSEKIKAVAPTYMASLRAKADIKTVPPPAP